jgi:hypothetical protein
MSDLIAPDLSVVITVMSSLSTRSSSSTLSAKHSEIQIKTVSKDFYIAMIQDANHQYCGSVCFLAISQRQCCGSGSGAFLTAGSGIGFF